MSGSNISELIANGQARLQEAHRLPSSLFRVRVNDAMINFFLKALAQASTSDEVQKAVSCIRECVQIWIKRVKESKQEDAMALRNQVQRFMEGVLAPFKKARKDVPKAVFDLLEEWCTTVASLIDNDAERVTFLVVSEEKIRHKVNTSQMEETYFDFLEVILEHTLEATGNLLDNEMFSECTFAVTQCQGLGNVAKELAKNITHVEKLQVASDYINEMNTMKCSAQAAQLRLQSLDILNQRSVSKEEAQQALGLLMDARDTFQDKDPQTQAEILSEIGHVYWKYLNDSKQATYQFHKCMDICNELSVSDKEWYQMAKSDMQEIEDAKKNSKPPERDVTSECEKISRQAEGNTCDFLAYVYSEYPPAGKSRLANTLVREQLRAARNHYHPDKMKSDPNLQEIYRRISMHINQKCT